MKHIIVGVACAIAGLVMAACGGAPEGGASRGSDRGADAVTAAEAEASGAGTEALKDPCAPICHDFEDPYYAENCACCHRHLSHPTCYQ